MLLEIVGFRAQLTLKAMSSFPKMLFCYSVKWKTGSLCPGLMCTEADQTRRYLFLIPNPSSAGNYYFLHFNFFLWWMGIISNTISRTIKTMNKNILLLNYLKSLLKCMGLLPLRVSNNFSLYSKDLPSASQARQCGGRGCSCEFSLWIISTLSTWEPLTWWRRNDSSAKLRYKLYAVRA